MIILCYSHLKLFGYHIITLLYYYNIILSYYSIIVLNYSVIIWLYYYFIILSYYILQMLFFAEKTGGRAAGLAQGFGSLVVRSTAQTQKLPKLYICFEMFLNLLGSSGMCLGGR